MLPLLPCSLMGGWCGTYGLVVGHNAELGGSSGGGVDYGSYRWLSVVGLIPEDKLEGTRVQ